MADYKKLMDMSSPKNYMDEGDSNKKQAKLEVLEELRKMAADMMGDDLDEGMKQVTVASPSQEGLEEGLETAEGMIAEMPEEIMGDEGEDMMMAEEGDMEYEDEEMDIDQLEEKIARLIAMKERMATGV